MGFEFLCKMCFPLISFQLLNAFANQTSAEMKGKLIMRIENITALQTQLSNCLASEQTLFIFCHIPGMFPFAINPYLCDYISSSDVLIFLRYGFKQS